MKGCDAILMIDASDINSNLYYATGFIAVDSFVYIQTPKEKVILTYSKDVEQLKKESKADRIVGYRDYEEKLEKKLGGQNFRGLSQFHQELEILSELLKELKVKKMLVPSNFGLSYYLVLKEKGFEFVWSEEETFFKERQIKTEEEIKYIQDCQQAAEKAMGKVKEILILSKVRNGCLYFDGEIVTSERLRAYLQEELIKNGCIPALPMIVSSGKISSQTHNIGHGPIKAGVPIIVDIFPRSIETRYWGDMTRTFVKGEAPARLKKMYQAVLEAQKLGLSMIKEGVSGKSIQKKVENFFASRGFPFEKVDGIPQGYTHNFGHGVGLDIHEYPGIHRIGDATLKAGCVVTAEPGLYYPDIGGVRIEDLIVVTKDGYRNLTTFEKEKFEL